MDLSMLIWWRKGSNGNLGDLIREVGPGDGDFSLTTGMGISFDYRRHLGLKVEKNLIKIWIGHRRLRPLYPNK